MNILDTLCQVGVAILPTPTMPPFIWQGSGTVRRPVRRCSGGKTGKTVYQVVFNLIRQLTLG